MIIEQCRTQNVDELLKYLEQLFLEKCDTILQKDQIPSRNDEIEWLNKKDGISAIVFIALENEKIIGMIDGQIRSNLQVNHNCEIGMSILKKYRRKGIGKQLLTRLIDWAKSKSIQRLELEVMSHNIPAIKLYESHGFIVEGIKSKAVKICENQYVDLILMVKLL
jgi:RimJ/RimL family protein N-acetyltransferase